jgi:predicted dehydrogenase
MKHSRREFLAGAAWMGAAAMAAGCMSRGAASRGIGGGVSGAPMHGFRVDPMPEVRVGVIGLGGRGAPAVHRLAQIPGCRVTAISDINAGRVDAAQKWLKENGYPAAREWSRDGSEDAWRGLCEWDGVDVVYSCTPRTLHCPINVHAMSCGKHVMQEVPGVFDLEECWATVEAAEKYRRHCYMLENCVYGEFEMLAFNLVKKGMLGEILQAESCYTHDQRHLMYEPADGVFWRIKRHQTHHGNYYPTHGLVPAGRCLDINRGDKFDYLVAMETKSASFEAYGAANYPPEDWRHGAKMVKGDVTTCLMRTANGKVLQLVHNVCTPTPYDRGNKLLGTKGTIVGIKEDSYRVGFEEKLGDNGAHHYFSKEKAAEVREAYKHPFWKVAGEIAQKVGGHGGMDFIMDLRWVYCLQNGLPMDTDVYDLATYSSVVELSERSVNAGSRPVEFPDYTRGGWKTAKPFTVDEMDMSKFNFSDGVKKDADALTA